MSERLKACPFCGSDDVELVEGNLRYITCNNCCGTGPDCHSSHEAVEAWSARAGERARVEIRRDSERLDWLEKTRSVILEDANNGWRVTIGGIEFSCMEETARDAIDAARDS